MPRTVAALYDSRAEAELAGVRLVSQLKAKPPRIIGRDTVAAVDDLRISKDDVETYRQELRRGAHLLVAQVPSGASAERVIELLEQARDSSLGELADARENGENRDEGVSVRVADNTAAGAAPAITPKNAPIEPAGDAHLASDTVAGGKSEPPARVRHHNAPPEEHQPMSGGQELRIGRRQVAGARARVRAFTHDAPAEEQVTLRDQMIEVESRPCNRTLTDNEVEAGGLFKERVFEATETREEPVVTKVPVVREEVIVRKTVKERTETIRETVQQTDIEVEDLPGTEKDSPTFFGDGETGRPPENIADQWSQDGAEENEKEPTQREGQAHSSAWF
jgi:hypothetical protein